MNPALPLHSTDRPYSVDNSDREKLPIAMQIEGTMIFLLARQHPIYSREFYIGGEAFTPIASEAARFDDVTLLKDLKHRMNLEVIEYPDLFAILESSIKEPARRLCDLLIGSKEPPQNLDWEMILRISNYVSTELQFGSLQEDFHRIEKYDLYYSFDVRPNEYYCYSIYTTDGYYCYLAPTLDGLVEQVGQHVGAEKFIRSLQDTAPNPETAFLMLLNNTSNSELIRRLPPTFTAYSLKMFFTSNIPPELDPFLKKLIRSHLNSLDFEIIAESLKPEQTASQREYECSFPDDNPLGS